MERLAQQVNGDHDSNIELYINEEELEWQLQARFNAMALSQKETLQRVEKNGKGLLEARKEYHWRIETLKRS